MWSYRTSTNFWNKLKQKELDGLTRREALIEVMDEMGNYAIAVETHDDEHVNMLFFVRFKAIKLAQAVAEHPRMRKRE